MDIMDLFLLSFRIDGYTHLYSLDILIVVTSTVIN